MCGARPLLVLCSVLASLTTGAGKVCTGSASSTDGFAFACKFCFDYGTPPPKMTVVRVPHAPPCVPRARSRPPTTLLAPAQNAVLDLQGSGKTYGAPSSPATIAMASRIVNCQVPRLHRRLLPDILIPSPRVDVRARAADMRVLMYDDQAESW